MMAKDYVCHDCKKLIDLSYTRAPLYCGGAGYGRWGGEPGKICYPCMAKRVEKDMHETGRAILYIARDRTGWKVSDWADELVFRPHRVRKGHHNIAGSRLDVWFMDNQGHAWHGINIGDHQLLRCKRLKRQPQ
jgi:hypothetical protein